MKKFLHVMFIKNGWDYEEASTIYRIEGYEVYDFEGIFTLFLDAYGASLQGYEFKQLLTSGKRLFLGYNAKKDEYLKIKFDDDNVYITSIQDGDATILKF